MKTLTKTSLVVALLGTSSVSFAGGLERTGQSVLPLFETGNYAEATYSWVNPNISGKDALGNKIDDVMQEYSQTTGAVKIAPSANSALMLSYEQPFGVDAKYPQGNLFANELGATTAKVDTDSLSLIGGGKLTPNVWLYGGMEYQTAKGKVIGARPVGVTDATLGVLDKVGLTQQQFAQMNQLANSLSASQLAGLQQLAQTGDQQAIQTLTAVGTVNQLNQKIAEIAQSSRLYQLDIDKDHALAPVVGVAFEKPEIALRAAVTYHAPAKYNSDIKESAKVPSIGLDLPSTGSLKFEMPQSVNVDFQTGLNQKTLLTANGRWINWKKFDVRPSLYATETGESLATYKKDQYSVKVGLGRQVTPKLAVSGAVLYDTGTDEPYSLLGPYGDSKGVEIGAQYQVTPAMSVAVGGQYLKLGDAVIKEGGQEIATFSGNDAYALGAKVAYKF